MSKPNGGPAFPCEWDYINTNRAAANGMTMRDYFAATAMSIIPEQAAYNMKSNEKYEAYIARRSYELADAMLEARK